MVQGIIFDFNGTMVFDGHLHEKAWVEMIHKHNEAVSAEEIIAYIHGRTNEMIISHFIGEVQEDELEQLAAEKEMEYQRLVRAENIWYVAGTEALLNELVKREIPFTIATASPRINVEFYFDYFELGRWFAFDEIIFDDGSFPGKPNPTIYKKAAAHLNLDPKACVVIEDATAGIQAANRAGIGKVFIMTTSQAQKEFYEQSDLEFEAILTDFNGFLEQQIGFA